VERRTDSVEVARGRCLVAGNLSVKTSSVPTEELRRPRPNMKRCYCISDFPCPPFESSTGQKPCTVL